MNAVRIVILLALCSPLYVLADSLDCQGTKVTVDFANSNDYGADMTLTASRDTKNTILWYYGGFVGAECRKNPKGKYLIVYQAYCGGSGCKDLANYGIIDPISLEVLLVPNDWNRNDAKRIFGAEVEPIRIENMYSAMQKKRIGDRSH